MSQGEQLPRITTTEEAELLRQLNSMVDTLNRRLEAIEMPSGRIPWDITNVSRSTTIDGSSATAEQVRDCLATLLDDMKTRGDIA